VERLRLRVGCEFVLDADAPVPTLMLVQAHPDQEHHTLYESHWLRPDVPLHEYVDLFGNRCWRFTVPAGELTVRYDAVVETDREPDLVHPDVPLVAVESLPDETLLYTLPSRYVQSDQLIDDAWRLFGETPPTWARVQAVCDWIHANVQYETGSSHPGLTAVDIYHRRMGVCRDFALLATALCRALNIPARYTFGYLPDIAVEPPDVPMDFHAWFEAYLGGRWYTFDARHNRPRIGRVVIGRGRDAVDVAMTTHFGLTRLRQMTVWADEMGEDEPAPAPQQAERPADRPAVGTGSEVGLRSAEPLGDLVKGVGQG
jgi:transglutaminase-like putative cysteine protease